MRESSVSERSATPVPASIRMSLSRSIDVVRKCRPPIPPLHPRIRSFMERSQPLFLVEHGYPVPFGWRRVSALSGRFLRVQLVESAPGVHALQVEEVDFHLIPLAGAVRPDRLVPEPKLVQNLLLDLGLQPHWLVYRDCLVLALDLDLVDLLENHVLHKRPGCLPDEYPHAVVLGACFQPGSDVHGISHSGVRPALFRPHVPDPDVSSVDADADFECLPAARREFLVQLVALAQPLQGRKNPVARAILVLHRSIPESHDRVAYVLVERAAVLAPDDIAHVREVLVDVFAQVLGTQRFRYAGEAAYIGK